MDEAMAVVEKAIYEVYGVECIDEARIKPLEAAVASVLSASPVSAPHTGEVLGEAEAHPGSPADGSTSALDLLAGAEIICIAGEEFRSIDPFVPDVLARIKFMNLENKYKAQFRGTALDGCWTHQDVAKLNDADYGALHELGVRLSNPRVRDHVEGVLRDRGIPMCEGPLASALRATSVYSMPDGPEMKRLRGLVECAGYTIQCTEIGGWYALLPGETEFFDNAEESERTDVPHSQNYLGFFDSEKELLEEVGDHVEQVMGPFAGVPEGAWVFQGGETSVDRDGRLDHTAFQRVGHSVFGLDIIKLQSGWAIRRGSVALEDFEINFGVTPEMEDSVNGFIRFENRGDLLAELERIGVPVSE